MRDLTSLHQSLAEVSLGDRSLSAVLTDIVGIARRALVGAEAASITLIRGENGFTAAFDGQLAIDADELQYQRGYGPCMDAGRAGQSFLVSDMRTEHRWPDYARHAAARGALSSLSVPLPFQATTIGALNTYATRPDAYTDEDVEVATDVAAWVALAVANADRTAQTVADVANMRTAMASRAVIEQAKGILMERHKLSEDAAFTVLSRASQDTNIKLREIAETLVLTGVLPESARRGGG